jgi:predicted alpha/beta superfamily hydrolase
MSPSLWWADEELLRRWSAPGATLPDPIALWFDMGTAEQRAVPDGHVERARRLEALFAGRTTVRCVIDDGAKHHESAWAARLPAALRWTMRTKQP